ncbi:signal transduction histidine kinase : Histidine kinase OS=uncultured bacterium GN=ACD_79C01504G0002 PE=4 SV=1: Hpt: H-kinase_dim: HATPase_c: CheW: CheW: Response_reg [Tuwongella immobilis]|uniref:histidine kinase n=1 Tax=Tuwongella immobilis TaxID=692036 RepID=A0A6C2YLF3_9BACT|nr:signal transduction histidine kinase : Histidine kinase OS=uncultured bacterium GN=ACD_79C01504G0002 PE=4 SV=1: Hpt: H-kinase_dim: HATPase_c: CheW: CheW: Response_reg [Tuwongella immobilis]VTS00855.1 signal transduction histidine kinase : Histidine kinase OS=uncultured bacterium GN=ACD_79C01504G0002 PE=4 SV=1: Hpt: H-kinase_dim: HATPase_c: CheW: CheW: Response_reg [Tuwongella immobilis]
MIALERRPPSEWAGSVQEMFRAIHSVKGTAGVLGFSIVESLAHAMETVLEQLRAQRQLPTHAVIDLLLSANDRMVALIDDLEHCHLEDVSGLVEKLREAAFGQSPASPPGSAGGPASMAGPTAGASSSSESSASAASGSAATGAPQSPYLQTLARFEVPGPPLAERPATHDHLYGLTVDFMACFQQQQRTPVQVLELIQRAGVILLAQLDVPERDLSGGLPQGAIRYRALIASPLPPLQFRAALPIPMVELVIVELPVTATETVPSPQAVISEAVVTHPAPRVEPLVPSGDPALVRPPATPTPAPQSLAVSTATLTPSPTLMPLAGTTLAPSESGISELPMGANSASASASSNQPPGMEKSSTLRIPVQLVDHLMTLAGELVLIRNQVMQSVSPNDTSLRPIVQRLNGIVSELQDAVMRTRMQPVGNLFNRFPRLVRDLGRQLGKQIRLEITGSEVELDKTVLETLSDPLTHLIRNACDHGIESPERRLATGKPAEGRISLNARHHGGQITIEISDDGKGLDPVSIRRKALQNGLSTSAELDRMSPRELYSLILLPGFSTAVAVTDVSGRGVGMDVVKVNLDRLGGGLEIESEPGQGTTFLLRVPLTLAIIPCLLVRIGSQRYALPQKDLEELVCLHGEHIAQRVETAFDQEVVRLRDQLLPLVRLSEVLSHPRPFTSADRSDILRRHRVNRQCTDLMLWFAVVKVGDQRFGLVVDEILSPEEIVVKPMHNSLKRLACFSGATILGDGKVSLILSVEGIARHVGVRFQSTTALATQAANPEADSVQNVLLFRSGPQEQFALPLAMIRRIVPLDINKVERVGDREFLTIDGVSTLLVRLEKMLSVSPTSPSQNQLLILPKNVRRAMGVVITEVIDTIPVKLEVTPDTCPVDGLVGTQLVNQKITLFLDIFRLADLVEQHERPNRAIQATQPLRGRDRPRRVLLVEDTQFFRHLVRGYLETLHFTVTTAVNGAEGLAIVEREEPFDLIVSDIEMPVMDGWEFARNLREHRHGANVPLLALTTLNSENDREKARQLGFDRHEVKLDRERFLQTVRDMLPAGRGGER